MKNLIVIYGSPRTASSFLLGALVQHKQCFGTDWLKEKKVGGTNENSRINIHGNPNDTQTIDDLWKEFVPKQTKDSAYLVLKAPGYCFAYPYFSKLKGYACKYIFVDRDPIEVADSMSTHDPSRNVLLMNLESTDCPNKEDYRTLWDLTEDLSIEMKIINRAIIRYHWHIKNIPYEMLEQSLNLALYRVRKHGKETAKKIQEYLDIPPDNKMSLALDDFYHRTVSVKRQKEIKDALLPTIKGML